jgi:phospholipase C
MVDHWPLEKFDNGNYHLKVHGPNGFFRAFAGNARSPLSVKLKYEQSAKATAFTGNVLLQFQKTKAEQVTVLIHDNAYHAALQKIVLTADRKEVLLDLSRSSNWYDVTVTIEGDRDFMQRYAGHVETGKVSRTDPAMA